MVFAMGPIPIYRIVAIRICLVAVTARIPVIIPAATVMMFVPFTAGSSQERH